MLFTAGTGPHMVWGTGTLLGTDLCLCFGGGTRPHLGATALAIPRPSLKDGSQTSASASVICVPGHKEDLLARSFALEAASRLNCRVSVSIGLHVDNAGREDIALLQENCAAVLELVLQNIERLRIENAEAADA